MTRAGRARATPGGTSGPAPASEPGPSHTDPASESANYAEDRCALSPGLLAAGICLPVLAIALFVAELVVQVRALYWPSLAVLFLAAVGWIVSSGVWLRYLWPTGIRMDQAGVRIGGVHWAQRHPGQVRDRTAIVPRQCSQVFGCPWSAVLGIGVTTDRAAIKAMQGHAYRGRKPTPLGNLAAPYMRAALVIWVDKDRAQFPSIRQAGSVAWPNNSEPGFHQPVWVAPTRQPRKLEAALARQPLPAGAVRDVREFLGPGSPAASWLTP
jgi:hypothetical protein